MIKFLVELGNKLDKLGHVDGADMVDAILEKLASPLPHDEDWDDMEPSDEDLELIESEEVEPEGELTLDELIVQIKAVEGMLEREDVPEDIKENILPSLLKELKDAVDMLTKEKPAWGASREVGLPGLSNNLPFAEASKE